MQKNKLSDPYFRNQQWNVDERVHSEMTVAFTRKFDTRAEAEEFIDEYNSKVFNPENKDMWRNVLRCLQDDEDGAGYLFDHFKSLETQIKHWLEE